MPKPKIRGDEQCARIPPTVLKAIQDLLGLQSVDMRLNEVRARLSKFPQKLSNADARLAGAKAEVDQSKAAQLASFKDRKKYELDVEQLKDRVKKYRDQMSQVKTNEAYRALQHEIETAEAEIAKAEDRLLEQMVSGEEYDRRIKTSEKALKEVEDLVRVERNHIEEDKAATEKKNAELLAERTRVVAEISENLLDHYERIAKKHNNIALAEVRDAKMRRLWNARAASRVSGDEPPRQRRNVSLRDLHAHSLLHRTVRHARGPIGFGAALELVIVKTDGTSQNRRSAIESSSDRIYE